MMYPGDFQPIKTETELLAVQFSLLASAYARLALHEEQDRKREEAEQRSHFESAFSEQGRQAGKSYAERGREQMGL